jgi:hypothetical protein
MIRIFPSVEIPMNKLAGIFALLTLTACTTQPMAPMSSLNTGLQARSIARTDTPTLGTAKALFEFAQQQALAWSPNAVVTHIEGRNISATGRNEAAPNATWVFTFVDPNNRNQGVRFFYRGDSPEARRLTVAFGSLPATEPLEERAWGYDSNKAVTAARRLNAEIPTPVPMMELVMEQGYLLWKIPAGITGTVVLDAMHGQPPVRRR